jgi:uncharacterized membrane protein HdeD (DUF308 family)
MASNVQKIDEFHDSRQGKFTFGIAELALAYIFFVWATDSASFIAYLLTLLFFVGGLRNIVNARHAHHHGKKPKR